MKISIDKIRLIPKNLGFGFCVYGTLDEQTQTWANHWGLEGSILGPYTNLIPKGPINIGEMFNGPKIFEYGDFFSPNLNKDLHLGHLSNLILAKALQSLGIANKTIAILGDTLDGLVSKEDALTKYNHYCEQYGYSIDDLYFASEQKLLRKDLLTPGEGDYLGTQVFDINGEKMVGIKSSGATTYFYQDVALASQLNASTLYITGLEQNGHFATLKKLFPDAHHRGLGLVTVDGKKMSSSEGTVVMMEETLNGVMPLFDNDPNLTWNVVAGHILKYDLPSMKDINMKQITNVKTSYGLYLSYTLSRLKSAGLKPVVIQEFSNPLLQFKALKAQIDISPNVLFIELVEHARDINRLYLTHKIKDNKDNQKIFQPMLDDLLHGMRMLGLFEVEKVERLAKEEI